MADEMGQAQHRCPCASEHLPQHAQVLARPLEATGQGDPRPVRSRNRCAVQEVLRDDADAPAPATRMWPATRRPFGPERRKDPAARHRHEQAETGVPPAKQVARRRRQREVPPSNVVSFWSDDKDA